MSEAEQAEARADQVAVEPRLVSRDGPGWRIEWRIANRGREAIDIESAWLPHSRFRSEEQRLLPPPTVAPNGEATISTDVASAGASGETIRNAFLILRLREAGHLRRLFVRLRVSFDAYGRPEVQPEAVTLQGEGANG